VGSRDFVINSRSRFEHAMGVALEEAHAAGSAGEIPIGAVLLDSNDDVLAASGNRRERDIDPTAHAEVIVMREAALQLGTWRLTGCSLLVTVEPCPMCAGASVLARIGRLVFGAWNEEYGASGSRWDLVRDRRLNHRIEVISGIRADEGAALVREFLADQREGEPGARA